MATLTEKAFHLFLYFPRDKLKLNKKNEVSHSIQSGLFTRKRCPNVPILSETGINEGEDVIIFQGSLAALQ